uniref:Septin-type G domain-containing protein n=1 Tax=Rousettus aegyptiacus TaxID=9407 RepID=A0A7J8F4Q1_ROUAE|nr:hypothetical protein HJG63_017375 [Rousettus aegyptiacus]
MDPLRWSSSPSSSGTSSPRTPPCEMLGYVGIEAVLDQLKIKAMKMGFEFNIMVVGQSGLGKSTMTVNVVPVIARADSLTIEERENFRRQIQHDLKTHCIDVYPQKCFDDDINDRILNSKIRERIPFAVVGADREHLVNGKCVLGRKTKWGIVEVENMAHCEFPLLRDLLIRSHLQDLKDITHNVHYENYRVCRLNESDALPRGPGWVKLAPAPTSPPATPGPSKVRRRTQDNSTE